MSTGYASKQIQQFREAPTSGKMVLMVAMWSMCQKTEHYFSAISWCDTGAVLTGVPSETHLLHCPQANEQKGQWSEVVTRCANLIPCSC